MREYGSLEETHNETRRVSIDLKYRSCWSAGGSVRLVWGWGGVWDREPVMEVSLCVCLVGGFWAWSVYMIKGC